MAAARISQEIPRPPALRTGDDRSRYTGATPGGPATGRLERPLSGWPWGMTPGWGRRRLPPTLEQAAVPGAGEVLPLRVLVFASDDSVLT